MAKAQRVASPDPSSDRLLAALGVRDYQNLVEQLELTAMPLGPHSRAYEGGWHKSPAAVALKQAAGMRIAHRLISRI